MKKVRELKSWVEGYQGVANAVSEVELALEFYKEGGVTEVEVDASYQIALACVEELEMKNMLSREEDQMGAVLKIVAGAGGTEAQDWADMLFRMYQRWCERQGYKAEITNYQ